MSIDGGVTVAELLIPDTLTIDSTIDLGVFSDVLLEGDGDIVISQTFGNGVVDDFGTSHTYWDGGTVDVSGTIWDGLQGTSFADFANANDTNTGELTIRKNTTNNDGSSSPFDVAALYINVIGDFDAKVEMPGVSSLEALAFRTHSLAAWTP